MRQFGRRNSVPSVGFKAGVKLAQQMQESSSACGYRHAGPEFGDLREFWFIPAKKNRKDLQPIYFLKKGTLAKVVRSS